LGFSSEDSSSSSLLDGSGSDSASLGSFALALATDLDTFARFLVTSDFSSSGSSFSTYAGDFAID
jgi:hypothetical protein